MRIFQSPCRANTNKPVKTTLEAMQPANAIIAGLKSVATTAVSVACRALWIKNAIIAKYEPIIASTNRNRRAPNLAAVTRGETVSVVLCKLAPCIGLSASHELRSHQFTLGSDRRRHQTLFRDSHIFPGDWRTACSAFSGSADGVAWPHRSDSAPRIDGRRAWLPVLSSRQIRHSVQIASLERTKFISSILQVEPKAGVVPAIANAVFAAIGKRLRKMPVNTSLLKQA
jgi:hypothetical protein